MKWWFKKVAPDKQAARDKELAQEVQLAVIQYNKAVSKAVRSGLRVSCTLVYADGFFGDHKYVSDRLITALDVRRNTSTSYLKA